MAMHNPPHPGEFITQVYLEPNHLSGRELAAKLGVAASTLHRILVGSSRISPEMALRLSKALGRSPPFMLHDYFKDRGLGDKVKLHYTYPIGRIHSLENVAKWALPEFEDRKSTRLNSSHHSISYAV